MKLRIYLFIAMCLIVPFQAGLTTVILFQLFNLPKFAAIAVTIAFAILSIFAYDELDDFIKKVNKELED